MTSELEIREFQRTDNIVYSDWFGDPEMDKYMGPAWSSEELDEIEAEKGSCVLSVYLAQELVGIVSVTYPDTEHSSYGVMGLAVAPHKQRLGIGAHILTALPDYFKTNTDQEWVAYVDPQNIPSLKFMVKNGWERRSSDNKMHKFTYKQLSTRQRSYL